MVSKPTEKVIEALTLLAEGFMELQEAVESDSSSFAIEDEEAEEGESEEEIETLIINQVRLAIDSVIESEDYSPIDFAALISALTEALGEIDPSVFEEDDTAEAGSEYEESYDEDEDDEDYDLDEDEEFEDEEEDEDFEEEFEDED